MGRNVSLLSIDQCLWLHNVLLKIFLCRYQSCVGYTSCKEAAGNITILNGSCVGDGAVSCSILEFSSSSIGMICT